MLVYDKSNQHATIYDSHNFDLAAKTIQSIRPSNFSDIYSLTDENKYSINNLAQKYSLYKLFVAWGCNGSSVAPLTDYINNPIHQELRDKEDYNEVKSDEIIYLDLRISSGCTKKAGKLEINDSKINVFIQLKTAATKKNKAKSLYVFNR